MLYASDKTYILIFQFLNTKRTKYKQVNRKIQTYSTHIVNNRVNKNILIFYLLMQILLYRCNNTS